MYKIGVDIVKISRIEKSIQKHNFLDEVYTNNELEYSKNSVETLAGIFAAKEAYFKAIQTGLKRPINQIEILHLDNGKPYLNNIENCDLSISHDGEYAIATVIVW